MKWYKMFADGKGGFEIFQWGLEYDAYQVAIKVVQTLIICLLFPFFVIPVVLFFIPSESKRVDRVTVPIVCILLCLYMLIDYNMGWFFCYLYRDTFPDFFIYANMMFAYSILWFCLYLFIEFCRWKEVTAAFDTWEASPYGFWDLVTMWIFIPLIFFYWFEPNFYDTFVQMVPEQLSPYFQDLNDKVHA